MTASRKELRRRSRVGMRRLRDRKHLKRWIAVLDEVFPNALIDQAEAAKALAKKYCSPRRRVR